MWLRQGFFKLLLAGIFCLFISVNVQSGEIKPDIVVAKDGSGDYTKVKDAVSAAKSSGTVIFIKPGVYEEQVRVPSGIKNLKLIGESYETTIITRHDDKGWDHATWIISGEDFYAENLTIRQTVDMRKGGRQAEALSVRADRATFYKCKITGFQDTYRMKGIYRGYHKRCIIDGTTDFIYGNGIGLFEDCIIRSRASSHITAHNQSKKDSNIKFGFVFMNCDLTVHPDEKDVTAADLGRPYGNGAKVVYFNCNLGSHIRPAGWSVWKENSNHKTSFFAEYKNTGPGANPDQRVSWSHQLSDEEAKAYVKENILSAEASAGKCKGDWNPVIEEPAGLQHITFSSSNPERFYSYSNNILRITAPGAEKLEVRIFTLDGALALRQKFESANSLAGFAMKIQAFTRGYYPIQSLSGNTVKSGYVHLY